MKKIFILLAAIVLSAPFCEIAAQKIMVIPYTKQGEDLRTKVEDDNNYRIAITKVKEAFDNAGASTIDLIPKLKAMSNNIAFQQNTQNDLKKMVIEQSGADFYVEVEVIPTFSNGLGSCKLIMTAYDASSAESLANKVSDSGQFNTTDFGALAAKAAQKVTKQLVETMDNKFQLMVANGRAIMINFAFSQDSDMDMESQVSTGNLLKEELELWMEENSFNNQYHLQGVVDKSMIFDEVRIPVFDENTGRPVTPSRWMMKLRKFLRQELKLNFNESINQGKVFINFE